MAGETWTYCMELIAASYKDVKIDDGGFDALKEPELRLQKVEVSQKQLM